VFVFFTLRKLRSQLHRLRLCTPQGISHGNDFLHRCYVMDANDPASVQDGGGYGGCRSFHPFTGFPAGNLANERFP
jgi:hypothetical protein